MLGATEILDSLRAAGWPQAEVFAKTGRSRRFDFEDGWEGSTSSEECGWAVRAADGGSSFFFAASGHPAVETTWPDAREGLLRLPPPMSTEDWQEPGGVETPLMGELEGRQLLRTVAETLEKEAPEGRLRRAILEDGGNEIRIHNSWGVDVGYRSRLATCRLEAAIPSSAAGSCAVVVVARRAQELPAAALARRLADLLHVCQRGRSVEKSKAVVMLSPELATHILAWMVPLFIGSEPEDTDRWLRPGTKVAAPSVTVVDDGRLAGGLLSAPVDGEGVPTRARVLIDAGKAGEPILPWWLSQDPVGCRQRAGWRDLPITGATHLYLVPDRGVSVGAVLSSLRRGYYLIEATAPGFADVHSGRFFLPCCGFEVEKGRATMPVTRVGLEGDLRTVLQGVRAVARDLTFLPRGPLVGSASILVSGLDLRRLD